MVTDCIEPPSSRAPCGITQTDTVATGESLSYGPPAAYNCSRHSRTVDARATHTAIRESTGPVRIICPVVDAGLLLLL